MTKRTTPNRKFLVTAEEFDALRDLQSAPRREPTIVKRVGGLKDRVGGAATLVAQAFAAIIPRASIR